ncbi:MAG: adenine phosphoribosyltransferase [Pseudomonadota bacterium]
MDRLDFHKSFKATGPVVIPVIHVLDTPRTVKNIEIAIREGAAGVFLINHDFGVPEFLPIITDVRRHFPSLFLGVNFLGVSGRDAFPILATLEQENGTTVDAYWADNAHIDENGGDQETANDIAAARDESGWRGLYFGGTAFKKQRPVKPEDYAAAAREARPFMDVITTSGTATGIEADLGKIDDFREGAGDQALALASGITPENAHSYTQVDCFMVATGINEEGNFYDIDAARLRRLMEVTRNLGAEARDAV